MDLNKQYEGLASQLGDVIYKLHLLETAKEDLLKQISELDKLAGAMNAQKNKEKTESLQDGINSPD